MISELGTHVMILEKIHPSGVEEWYCPTCGRRMLLQWPPTFQSIVVEMGDISVQHSGSKGGIYIGETKVSPESENESLNEDLQVWADAVADLDMDGLGENASTGS